MRIDIERHAIDIVTVADLTATQLGDHQPGNDGTTGKGAR